MGKLGGVPAHPPTIGTTRAHKERRRLREGFNRHGKGCGVNRCRGSHAGWQGTTGLILFTHRCYINWGLSIWLGARYLPTNLPSSLTYLRSFVCMLFGPALANAGRNYRRCGIA